MKISIDQSRITLDGTKSILLKAAIGVGIILVLLAVALYVGNLEEPDLDIIYAALIAGGAGLFAILMAGLVRTISYKNVLTVDNSSNEIVFKESQSEARIPFSNIKFIKIDRQSRASSATSSQGQNTQRVIEIHIRLIRHFGSSILLDKSSVINDELMTALKSFLKVPIYASNHEKRGESKFLEKMKEVGAKIDDAYDQIPDAQKLGKDDKTRFSVLAAQNPSYKTSTDGRSIIWKSPIALAGIFLFLSVIIGATAAALYESIALVTYFLGFVAIVFFYGSISSLITTNSLRFEDDKLVLLRKGLGAEKEVKSMPYKEMKAILSDINNSSNKPLLIINQQGTANLKTQDFLSLIRGASETMMSINVDRLSVVEKINLEKMILSKIQRGR